VIRLATAAVPSSPWRECGQPCRGRHRVAAAIWDRVKGAHTFNDRVTGFAGCIDDLVELQVQLAEVSADEIPVSLLAL
jgi:hypothetical protein